MSAIRSSAALDGTSTSRPPSQMRYRMTLGLKRSTALSVSYTPKIKGLGKGGWCAAVPQPNQTLNPKTTRNVSREGCVGRLRAAGTALGSLAAHLIMELLMNCTTSPASLCPLMFCPETRSDCIPRVPSIMEYDCKHQNDDGVESGATHQR